MTPYDGAVAYDADGEAIRQAVNKWIRAANAFDHVIDFDAVVRDPEHPARLRAGFDSGDHIHPNPAGYKAMADSIVVSDLKATRQ
jgi:lysophospholipase L1-like esterase